MVYRNEYEYLRQPGESGGVPSNVETTTIYSTSAESIMLTTAEMQPGVWSYGYTIYFENGRKADRSPGDLAGWFKSREDAKRYFLGYLLQYRNYFSAECIREVKRRLLNMIQTKLFL